MSKSDAMIKKFCCPTFLNINNMKANVITRSNAPTASLLSDIKDTPVTTRNTIRAANKIIVTTGSAILTTLGHL